MADNPWDPAPRSDQPQAPQGAPDTTQAAGGWRDWIGKPDNRAALMQFGIAMMQPIGLGETSLSHAASAVGSGGQAAAKVQEQGQKQQELESKQDLRTSQAQLAEARASHAGERAGLTSALGVERLQLARERLSEDQRRNAANEQLRAMLQYQKYANDPLRDPTKPLLSPEEFNSSRGLAPPPVYPPLDPSGRESKLAALREALRSPDPKIKADAQETARKLGISF